MLRDWRFFLEDMHASCSKIIQYTQGMSKDDLLHDNKTYDAVVRNLEIIGEAAKHIPDDARTSMPEINWRGAAGLRDMLAHEYFGLDDDILWNIVRDKVPELLENLNNYMN